LFTLWPCFVLGLWLIAKIWSNFDALVLIL
jgi:hypothetical protein